MEVEKEIVADALKRARDLMNDYGAHWIKGHWEQTLENGERGFCSVGALRDVTGSRENSVLLAALQALLASEQVRTDSPDLSAVATGSVNAIADVIVAWNDDPNRTWPEVDVLFTQTEERVRAGL
jgi:hypothetical protein